MQSNRLDHTCEECPIGAHCTGSDVTWKDVIALQGWWRVPWSKFNATFESCPHKCDCIGQDPSDGAGTSDWVEATVVPFTKPSPPLDLTSTPGSGCVTLTWSATSNNGGREITKYEIQQDDNSVFLECTN